MSKTLSDTAPARRIDFRLTWWIGAGLLVSLAVLALVELARSWRDSRIAEYRGRLLQVTDEVIRLNDPIAAAFGVGQAPHPELVAVTLEALSTLQAELDALGSAPDELVEARAALAEAVGFYRRAFDHLAENLAAGVEMPFDADFIATAKHGGENIHRATEALDSSREVASCVGLRRLLPACWP